MTRRPISLRTGAEIQGELMTFVRSCFDIVLSRLSKIHIQRFRVRHLSSQNEPNHSKHPTQQKSFVCLSVFVEDNVPFYTHISPEHGSDGINTRILNVQV